MLVIVIDIQFRHYCANTVYIELRGRGIHIEMTPWCTVVCITTATVMSLSSVQQPWSGDRVNVFISTMASCIQTPIYSFGGNAFWCPSKSLSETCAVGRPASVQGLSQMITVSQRVTGTARCWGLLKHYLLNPVFNAKETQAISKRLWGNHTKCQKLLHVSFWNTNTLAKVCHKLYTGAVEDLLTGT